MNCVNTTAIEQRPIQGRQSTPTTSGESATRTKYMSAKMTTKVPNTVQLRTYQILEQVSFISIVRPSNRDPGQDAEYFAHTIACQVTRAMVKTKVKQLVRDSGFTISCRPSPAIVPGCCIAKCA